MDTRILSPPIPGIATIIFKSLLKLFSCRISVGRQAIHDYSLGCGFLKSVIFGGVDGLIISLSVISGAAGKF